MASTGRPRSFDKDAALEKVMLLFWEKGYEGTTMADIVSTIGTKAPSVYAAFGNKDTIFGEVVKRYVGVMEGTILKALNDKNEIYEAIESMLKASTDLFTNPGNPSTCLIMTAAINCAPECSAHVQLLKEHREIYKKMLFEKFSLAKSNAQLIDLSDPNLLAEFYVLVIQGLALRARDGSSKEELECSAKFSLFPLERELKLSHSSIEV